MPRLRFAGQITGVEGYVESAAIGLLAGRFAAAERLGVGVVPPPATTALGALLRHITGQRRQRQLPADEREFRPVPGAAGAGGPDPRPGARMEGPAQAADVPARARRPVGMVGSEGRLAAISGSGSRAHPCTSPHRAHRQCRRRAPPASGARRSLSPPPRPGRARAHSRW